MKKLTLIILVVMACALLAPPAWSQTSTVKGKVVDDQGQPVAGAVIQFYSKETGRKFELKTDKKGQYFSIGIAPGTYQLTVTSNGQLVAQLSGVPVKYGEENTFDFDLAKERAAQQQALPEAQKKQIEEAQKETSKVKGLNEKLAAARAAQDAGQYDQAVQILAEATQMDPTRDLLWSNLAEAERKRAAKVTDTAEKKATYQKAADDYQKAIALSPKADYYNNQADALARAGNVDGAIQAYQKAVEINPAGGAQYYFNMGAVYTNTGKVDDAIQAFDKAIQVDPTRADAYYWKGVNMMGKATLKGNKMEAPPGTAAAFNKYLELQPNGQFAQPAKDMLASMGAEVETTFGKAKQPAKKTK
ncbi:MAG TPA: tetratricopeptide repeat protein [Terriglobales bacterium]|nr:tetratricopeptide repeat protein [Terriglobales bacterium]